MIKILIVDDEEAASNMLRLLIEKQLPAQKEIRCVNSPQEALKIIGADYGPPRGTTKFF